MATIKSVNTQILGTDWEVLIVQNSDPLLIANQESCRGTCWFGAQRIALSQDLNGKTGKQVLVHELTHAYWYLSQVNHREELNDEDLCEFMSIFGPMIINHADRLTHQLWVIC